MPISESASGATTAGQLSGEFDVSLVQQQDFQFRIRFDDGALPALVVDAPPPIGQGSSPSPSRLLAAAAAHCFASGLLFLARESGVTLGQIEVNAHTQLIRNECGRLRIGKIAVEIDPHVAESQREGLKRCLELFEDFCMVSQSVRQGVEISCRVKL